MLQIYMHLFLFSLTSILKKLIFKKGDVILVRNYNVVYPVSFVYSSI